MLGKLNHPVVVLRTIIATLLLTASFIAVTHHEDHATPLAVTVHNPANLIGATDSAIAARQAEAEQRALQEAEAARLAQVQAAKARASRGARQRPIQPSYGGMPTVAQADALAGCESGDPKRNSGNGFYGAFQFMLRTWRNFRSGNPIDYTYEEQREVVMSYFPISSWHSQFPACYRKLHARGIV